MEEQPDFSMERAEEIPPPRRLPASKLPPLSYDENVRLRRKHLPPSLKTHYSESAAGAIKVAFGQGQYLYDHEGQRYVDCVNNVCHVGHCHPRVVTAASAQLSMLNTNTRYLHDNVVRLAQAVTETMPAPLEVAIFVNSGSEANDLALRLARAHTGRKDVYCVDGAYHGNSAATLAISPYSKYAAVEVPDGSVKLTTPDVYRHHKSSAEMAAYCADEFRGVLASRDAPPAAFIVESLICCGGQVVLPDGYLQEMHRIVRGAGGLAIADEVQTGFGRVGSHMWAFEAHDAVPDIVTIGKPFGNGFPLAAVVCTREVAESATQVEYFNTFGGIPVACAVGLEVLNVIEDEQLQQNALDVGAYTRGLVRELMASADGAGRRIGDVRGMGLIFGVEFVKDRETREPDAETAAHVMHWARTHANVLVSTDGPHANIIKMKPPLCFSRKDGEVLVAAIEGALRAL